MADQPPPWAHELLSRLTTLETTNVQTHDLLARLTARESATSQTPPQQDASPPPPPPPTTTLDTDPHVIVRARDTKFHPPQELLQQLPWMSQDFFRRPLPDAERRSFLFECPKNAVRNYQPPKALKIHTSFAARTTDTQLHDIQYRLSGLTRPIDWFAYRLATNQFTDIESLHHKAFEFTTAMHELISDVASHITELRTANLYKATNVNCKTPSVTNQDNIIIDPKAFRGRVVFVIFYHCICHLPYPTNM